MAKSLHKVRFPGESPAYREARNELLEAEVELRKKLEAVAALRRKLPLGGQIQEDYVFREGARDLSDTKTEKKIPMSELFAPGKDSLIIYSYMFGPRMPEP